MSSWIASTMRALAEAFDAGRFAAPVVAAHYSVERALERALARAREAYEAVAAGAQGRVVIDIG